MRVFEGSFSESAQIAETIVKHHIKIEVSFFVFFIINTTVVRNPTFTIITEFFYIDKMVIALTFSKFL